MSAQHTPDPTIWDAQRHSTTLGYGPQRRMWFGIGADSVLHPSPASSFRGARGTERQRRWREEGQEWARAVIKKARGQS